MRQLNMFLLGFSSRPRDEERSEEMRIGFRPRHHPTRSDPCDMKMRAMVGKARTNILRPFSFRLARRFGRLPNRLFWVARASRTRTIYAHIPDLFFVSADVQSRHQDVMVRFAVDDLLDRNIVRAEELVNKGRACCNWNACADFTVCSSNDFLDTTKLQIAALSP